MADFGSIDLGSILNAAPTDGAAAEAGTEPMPETETDEISGQLELIDPVKIVDFLKAKGILDVDFKMPEGIATPEPAEGGFGDIGMEEAAIPPTQVTGPY